MAEDVFVEDEGWESVVYSSTSAEEAELCTRPEMTLFYYGLAVEIARALRNNIKIIIDSEPVQYESALSMLVKAEACSSLGNIIKLEDNNKRQYRLVFHTFSLVASGNPSDVSVIVVCNKDGAEMMRDLEVVLKNPRTLYLVVYPGKPRETFTTAHYVSGLVLNAVKRALLILDKNYGGATSEYREKLKYLGRVPFETLLFSPLDAVRATAESWSPPPPPGSDYLREKYRPLESLVYPEPFKALVHRYMSVVRHKGRGSFLFVGFHGSGRKTLAKTIARELGLPAYSISLASILDKHVGESEKKLLAFFDAMRSRGGLAVFDGVDVLFRKTDTGSNVTANLRNILYQEMASEDNNFVVVFTTTEDAPAELFDSPIIGEVKLVVPPPNSEGRTRLIRMFLREILEPYWGRLAKIAGQITGSPEDYLFNVYGKPFIGATAGYVPREIWSTMEAVLVPAAAESMKRGKIVPIGSDVSSVTLRDFAARLARLGTLREKAVSVGQVEVAKLILEVEEEVSRRARENISQLEKLKR